MTPERNQNPVTFEEIVSNAKEIMIKAGHHVPIVIVEASNNLIAGQIRDLPATHGERARLMQFLGRATAKSGRVDRLQQVFMASEGWMSVANEDTPVDVRPPDDPERIEVLIVSAVKVESQKRQLKLFEVLRGNHEKVIGFKEFSPDEEKKDGSVDTPLLDAFVFGFKMEFRARNN